MENTELSNIAVDENGNQKPLDLAFEYEKVKDDLLKLTVKFLELKGENDKLQIVNAHQSKLLRECESDKKIINALEGKVVTLHNQNVHFKRILTAIKGTIDKGFV